MLIPKEDHTELLFPVIVQHREYGHVDVNERLVETVQALKADPGIRNRVDTSSITTVGGYQPDVALHRHLADDPAWSAFMKGIVEPSVEAYMAEHRRIAGWPVKGVGWEVVASWAVLYPSGAYQAPHLHRDISCVVTYYASVPVRPRPEGAITFITPHVESTFPALRNWAYDRHYFPMDGTCLVFPGWLQHFAHPHFSPSEERLMFSLDIRFDTPRA